MTPDQIVTELELLKDYTNDHGKSVLIVLLRELQPYLAVKAAEGEAPVDDVGESEQHQAEALGLTDVAVDVDVTAVKGVDGEQTLDVADVKGGEDVR